MKKTSKVQKVVITTIGVLGSIASLIAWYESRSSTTPVQMIQGNAAGCMIVRESPLGPQMLGIIGVGSQNSQDPLHEGRLIFAAPGGMVEEGETFQKAAERETQEETGYLVTAMEKVLTTTNVNSGTVFHLYYCKIQCEEERVLSDQEAVGNIWTNPSSIPLKSYKYPWNRDRFIETFGKVAAQNYQKTQLCK